MNYFEVVVWAMSNKGFVSHKRLNRPTTPPVNLPLCSGAFQHTFWEPCILKNDTRLISYSQPSLNVNSYGLEVQGDRDGGEETIFIF